jgi:protein-S-isoprenylcysteine O-methyltransferase Ste14
VERHRRLEAAVGSTIFLLVAPGLVAGVGPWLVTRWHVHGPLALHIVGAVLIAAGALVLLHAFVCFVVEGFGTPAPVAETECLVVGGLYRYVRNPMYIAVGATIVGQALLFGRPILLAYAAVFWAITAAFVHWYEEPHLKRRYGAEYEAYRRSVPAWFPRRRGRRVAM